MATLWGLYGSKTGGGSGSFATLKPYNNILPPAPVPPVFRPTDLSDCALWLDANDTSTVVVNGDTSGNNVNRVMKWFDKAQPSNQNYFRHIGAPAGSGLYNTHYMNQLNTIYFEPNAAMYHKNGGYAFNFQARTMFMVIKPITDLSGAPYPYIQTFIGEGLAAQLNYFGNIGGTTYRFSQCSAGIVCGLEFDINYNPVKNRMIIMYAQTDAGDLSGNRAAFDTVNKTLATSAAAGYETAKIQYYLNSQAAGTAQDIAEIILYGRLLTTDEQRQVNDYLADKWNASGPNFQEAQIFAPPPEAPAPAPAPLFVEGDPPLFIDGDRPPPPE